MTDVTIDQLPIIGTTQTRSARTIIQQEGQSFQAPTRPNPTPQINVSSQAQLEAELGTNIIIGSSERVTIVIDAAFTLNKPILFETNAALELYSSVNGAFLTYTGPGALFQNVNPINLVDSINLHNLNITGNGTNSVFDIVGGSVVIAREVIFSSFDSMGIIDNPQLLFDAVALVNLTSQGLILKNISNVSIVRTSVLQFAPSGMTAFTFQTTVPVNVDLNIVRALGFLAGDSLLFLDPNTPAGSIYSVQQSDVIAGDVYQPGVSIAINSVADNTSGKARFTTAVSHNLVVGQPVVLSAFAGQPTYNGTFIVTAVDTPVTGVTFDVEEITFIATDTGNMNPKSLDQEDVLVLARGNLTSPDSMFNGESGLEIFGAESSSSSLAQNAFEVVTNVAWVFAGLERFSVGVVNTGQLVCNDPKVRRYTVAYSGTIEKMGGGSVDVGVILLKNGSEIAFNPPHTVNSGKIQISGSDLVELTETDTIDIAVKNYDATAATILTSQLGLVVSKA